MSNAELKLKALLHILEKGGQQTASDIHKLFSVHKTLLGLSNSGLIKLDGDYYSLTRKGGNLIDGFARNLELFEA